MSACRLNNASSISLKDRGKQVKYATAIPCRPRLGQLEEQLFWQDCQSWAPVVSTSMLPVPLLPEFVSSGTIPYFFFSSSSLLSYPLFTSLLFSSLLFGRAVGRSGARTCGRILLKHKDNIRISQTLSN